MAPKEKDRGEKILASNRQAFHNYVIGERYEAGLVLLGTEVKSLRAGGANLKDAFARIDRGEAFLHNCHIAPYSHGGYANHDPLRPRKLLLHRVEILKLSQRTTAGGHALIPLRFYLRDGRVKAELALARGRKRWDKRQAIKEREQARDARVAARDRERG